VSDQSTYGKIPPGIDLHRNPITHRNHRREVLRQVILPVLGALLLAAVGIYLAFYFQVGSLEKWAELAAILMIAMVMVLALVPLVLAATLIYLASQILHQLPPAARRAQSAIEKVQRQVTSGADVSVEPLMQIQSYVAMVEAIFGRRK